MCSHARGFAVMLTESFRARTRVLLGAHPLPMLFPSEPWSEEDLETIADVFRAHVWLQNDVVTDKDPYVDWLERWAFHQGVVR